MSPKLRESLSVFMDCFCSVLLSSAQREKPRSFRVFFLFPRTCVFGKINGNELYPGNVGNRLDNGLPKTK